MESIRKISGILELNDADPTVLAWTKLMADNFDVKEVSFLHVVHEDELDQEHAQDLPRLKKILTREIDENIQQSGIFTKGPTPNVEVKLGVNVSGYLHKTIKNEQIDLLVIGFKEDEEVPELYNKSFIRSAQAKLLYVPENAQAKIENIMVPNDFSRFSKMALSQGMTLAHQSEAMLSCLNVLIPPTHFFPYIEEDEKEIEKLKKSSLIKVQELLKTTTDENLRQIPCGFVLASAENAGLKIYEYALENEVDLMLVGSGTTGWLDRFFTDDLAENIFSYDEKIPILIIKGSKNYVDLWKDIKKHLV